MAVSKTQSLENIKKAYESGQRDFGENYLQEAIQKIELYKPKNVSVYTQLNCVINKNHTFINPNQANFAPPSQKLNNPSEKINRM